MLTGPATWTVPSAERASTGDGRAPNSPNDTDAPACAPDGASTIGPGHIVVTVAPAYESSQNPSTVACTLVACCATTSDLSIDPPAIATPLTRSTAPSFVTRMSGRTNTSHCVVASGGVANGSRKVIMSAVLSPTSAVWPVPVPPVATQVHPANRCGAQPAPSLVIDVRVPDVVDCLTTIGGLSTRMPDRSV